MGFIHPLHFQGIVLAGESAFFGALEEYIPRFTAPCAAIAVVGIQALEKFTCKAAGAPEIIQVCGSEARSGYAANMRSIADQQYLLVHFRRLYGRHDPGGRFSIHTYIPAFLGQQPATGQQNDHYYQATDNY